MREDGVRGGRVTDLCRYGKSNMERGEFCLVTVREQCWQGSEWCKNNNENILTDKVLGGGEGVVLDMEL